ncbi:MAG: 2-oxoacid:acceptor oxidoreductase subunit alpha [Acidobacteria bacterium]|nr:2-oxoacid:acceptor oxidoreductase subunit alpha [Acidobacteriota bacterium]
MSQAYKEKRRFIQGNEACALGAIAAGCRFFAGYPITPSSEIAEVMAKELPLLGGKFVQMEDEIASIAAILGASLSGEKACTATSGPGFSLMQENIGYASLAEIPCVIINVMRGGPSTGSPTSPSQSDLMQAKWGTHGDHPVIVFAPAYISEIFVDTIHCFNLAEKYRVPVILLLDEVIGHMRARMDIYKLSADDIAVIERRKPTVSPAEFMPYDTSDSLVPPMAPFGQGYRFHTTGLIHDRTGFPVNDGLTAESETIRLMKKIYENESDIIEYEEYMTDDMDIMICTFGSTARSAKVAVNKLRDDGIKAGLFRAITLSPFPRKKLRELSARVNKIYVPEMNLGQLRLILERVTRPVQVPIIGINRINLAPISPDEIYQTIKKGEGYV